MRGSMVILLVGLLIPTNYHRPPIQPSSGKSDGRPRIVGARSAPFDIANAPKRTLRVAARRQIVFKGGSNAVDRGSSGGANKREQGQSVKIWLKFSLSSQKLSNFKCGLHYACVYPRVVLTGQSRDHLATSGANSELREVPTSGALHGSSVRIGSADTSC